MKIHHIAITVKNLQESVEFYTKNFGFAVAHEFERPDLLGKAAFIKLGDTHIELWEFEDAYDGQNDLHDLKLRGIRHIAFQVDDIDVEYQRFVDNGISVEKPSVGGSGSKYCFLQDPNGVQLELYEVKW